MRIGPIVSGFAAMLLASSTLAYAQDAPAPSAVPRVAADQATYIANLVGGGGGDDGAVTVWFRIDPQSNTFMLEWTIDTTAFAPQALHVYCGNEPSVGVEPDLMLADALGVGSAIQGEIGLSQQQHDRLVAGECTVVAQAEGDAGATIAGAIEAVESGM